MKTRSVKIKGYREFEKIKGKTIMKEKAVKIQILRRSFLILSPNILEIPRMEKRRKKSFLSSKVETARMTKMITDMNFILASIL